MVWAYSKLRNEVAHGTLKPVRGKQQVVPYFTFQDIDAQGITVAMIQHRTKEFEKAAPAVMWVRAQIDKLSGRQPESPEQEPELIQALRQKISNQPIQRRRCQSSPE